MDKLNLICSRKFGERKEHIKMDTVFNKYNIIIVRIERHVLTAVYVESTKITRSIVYHTWVWVCSVRLELMAFIKSIVTTNDCSFRVDLIQTTDSNVNWHESRDVEKMCNLQETYNFSHPEVTNTSVGISV